MKHKTILFIQLVIIILFFLYSYSYIKSSSVVIDGARYFSLFDDAMISMKYAWNLSHGEGLVWSPGSFVEGYTNFLWVLIISIPAFLLSKSLSILAVHMIGTLVLVATYLVWADTLNFFGSARKPFRFTLFSIGFFTYFPLIFWSLLGMETSLIALLVALLVNLHFRIAEKTTVTLIDYIKIGLIYSLLYLTRPDSLYIIGVSLVWLLLWENKFRLSNIKEYRMHSLVSLLPPAITVFVHLIFRYSLYENLIPNTVLLKVLNFPFEYRFITGFRHVTKYLFEHLLIWGACIAGIRWIIRDKRYVLLFALSVTTVLYQLYVGGDAWEYWRFFTPIFPMLLIISLESFYRIWSERKEVFTSTVNILGVIFLLLMFATYNYRFMEELLLIRDSDQVKYNKLNISYALGMNDFMNNQGTSGVFWAGTIPYYTDFHYIDFLGKMDEKIASKEVYVARDKHGNFLSSHPGHNKFDLHYSIIELAPDVIQNIAWMNENAAVYDGFNYKLYEYKGSLYWVLQSSENINFTLLNELK